MKKTLILSAAAAAFLVASPVPAEDYGGDKAGRMEAVDTDGDGKISKDEFLARHEEMFEKMDKDGDGYISRGEKRSAHKKMKEKRHEMRDKMKERREERRQGG